jgi:hypothetical protein
MKKRILFSRFCFMLTICSCGADLNKQKDNTQAKIDSMVNAKVDSLFSRLKMQNDSIINAKANTKAQEIISGKSK